jgi:thiamine biosynthesis lipoprotein
MGGSISAVLGGDATDELAAGVLDRIAAWAGFLSRHDPDSDLSRLNALADTEVRVAPTLAAALHGASSSRRLTGGLVDPAVHDARLAVETGGRPVPARTWAITGDVVTREPGTRLDLSGVAKGWMAERALWLPLVLPLPVAVIECDGDIAIRSDGSIAFDIQVEDPRADDPSTLEPIAVISLPLGRAVRIGVATSGTYRQSWAGRSHIVDPATGEPASVGVVTATVIAPDAIAAEALAKVVILRGAEAAPMLEAAGATAIALTDRGTQLRFPGVDRWLA